MDHLPNPEPKAGEAALDRRSHILNAAERCFVRAGFHRTTMQDVAAEANMSPGNLYRYFRSKEAIVVGISERDRARVIEDFGSLSTDGDFLDRLAALGRKHFEDEPRDKAILCLQIWAEATRDATFASITREFDEIAVSRMTSLFAQAQERGLIAGSVDPKALAIVLSTFADGLFVRRAVSADFEPEREIGLVMAIVEAAVAGRIAFPPAAAPAGAEGASS
jgi:AcrR family transcriptional regulator